MRSLKRFRCPSIRWGVLTFLLLAAIVTPYSTVHAQSPGNVLLPIWSRGSVIAVKMFSGRTTGLSSTAIVPQPEARGLYRMAWYILVTATGSSTNLVGTTAWTDYGGGARTSNASTVSCAATNYTSGQLMLVASSSTTPIYFSTALTGTCTYDLWLAVERLS